MKIIWTKPNFSRELGEYTENDFTQKYLAKKGFSFSSDDDLFDFLRGGTMKSMYGFDLSTIVNFTSSKKDSEEELKDPEYRKSFDSMESELMEKGEITLPAPIVLNFSGALYLFSGNRRAILAVKHGLPLSVWMVNAPEKTSPLDSFLKG